MNPFNSLLLPERPGVQQVSPEPGATAPRPLSDLAPKPLLQVAIERKHFDDKPVLSAVQFEVLPGEVVSLIGPSGCGKSTLLRVLAGLDAAFDGFYTLGGIRQHGPSPQIGVVFQEPRLLPWLNVADNIAFSKGHRQGHDPRVARYLTDIGLAGKAQLLPKHLSGGMAQRVALARSLFPEPDLLLLDEPFSAVDALTRERLQVLLKTLTAGRQTAVLMVTHDLDEALYLSDRILVIAPGAAGEGSTVTREYKVDELHPRTRSDSGTQALKRKLFDALATHDDVPNAANA